MRGLSLYLMNVYRCPKNKSGKQPGLLLSALEPHIGGKDHSTGEGHVNTSKKQEHRFGKFTGILYKWIPINTETTVWTKDHDKIIITIITQSMHGRTAAYPLHHCHCHCLVVLKYLFMIDDNSKWVCGSRPIMKYFVCIYNMAYMYCSSKYQFCMYIIATN